MQIKYISSSHSSSCTFLFYFFVVISLEDLEELSILLCLSLSPENLALYHQRLHNFCTLFVNEKLGLRAALSTSMEFLYLNYFEWIRKKWNWCLLLIWRNELDLFFISFISWILIKIDSFITDFGKCRARWKLEEAEQLLPRKHWKMVVDPIEKGKWPWYKM